MHLLLCEKSGLATTSLEILKRTSSRAASATTICSAVPATTSSTAGFDPASGNEGAFDEQDDGADYIEGGDGDDLLFGGSGPDYLVSTSGADELDGGPGNDVLDRTYNPDDSVTYVFRSGSGHDVLNPWIWSGEVEYYGGPWAEDVIRFEGLDVGDATLVWDFELEIEEALLRRIPTTQRAAYGYVDHYGG